MLYETIKDRDGKLIVVDLISRKRVSPEEEAIVLAQKEIIEASQQATSNLPDNDQEQTESQKVLKVL